MEDDMKAQLSIIAASVDLSDFMPAGSRYFWCGFREKRSGPILNLVFVRAIEEIGRAYRKEGQRQSDWHCGVDMVARCAGTSKSQVKSFRKQLLRGRPRGYLYKTPYHTHRIISEMVRLLKSARVPKHLEHPACLADRRGELYRDALLGEQLPAIRNATAGGPLSRRHERIVGLNQELDQLVGELWTIS